jgi:hypothetical protein
MNNIENNHATHSLPEEIARKLQAIARENEVKTFELMPERYWDQTCLLPRNSRAWYYTGGACWIHYSDGELFAEPNAMETQQPEFLSSLAIGEIWIITLDDGCEHLRVSRCSLSTAEKVIP